MSDTEEEFIEKANQCIPPVTQALMLLKQHMEEHIAHQFERFEDHMDQRILEMIGENCE